MAAEGSLDAVLAALAAAGESGQRLVAEAGGHGPLGPVDRWPMPALLATQLCLESAHPCALMLGEQFVLVHNDAYREVLGRRAATALLLPVGEVWPEVWDIVRPSLADVRRTGVALTFTDHQLTVQRNGFAEVGYFSYSLSPVRDMNGEVLGVLCQVQETTDQVLALRRLDTLHRLAVSLTGADSPEKACQHGVDALIANSADVGFALVFTRDRRTLQYQLVAHAGLPRQAAAELASPVSREAGWPFGEEYDDPQLVADVGALLPSHAGPSLAAERSGGALVTRLPTGAGAPQLWLVIGIGGHSRADRRYQEFAMLAARQLASGVDLAASLQLHRERSVNLEIALGTARQIGAALGVLMTVRKLTEEDAFALLRDASQHTHRKLRDVAAEVLMTGTLPA